MWELCGLTGEGICWEWTQKKLKYWMPSLHLNAFFASFFIGKIGCQEFQAPKTSKEIWSKEDLLSVKEDNIRERLNQTDIHSRWRGFYLEKVAQRASSLHHCRYSEVHWTWYSANCSSWPSSEMGGWNTQSQEVLFNFSHSVILWFYSGKT